MKVKFAFMVLLSAIIFAGCAATPKATANKYFKLLDQGDYQKARQLVSPESRSLFDEMIRNPKFRAEKVRITREVVTAEESTVYYTTLSSSDEKSIKLRKIGDKWRIQIPDENVK